MNKPLLYLTIFILLVSVAFSVFYTYTYTNTYGTLPSNQTMKNSYGVSLKGIILYFNFNNNDSTSYIQDNSLYNNNGSVQGIIIWNSTGGYDGSGAYEFGKGYDGYIVTSVSQDKNTVSFRVKNETSPWYYIVNASGTTYVDGVAATPLFYPVYNNGNVFNIGGFSTAASCSGTPTYPNCEEYLVQVDCEAYSSHASECAWTPEYCTSDTGNTCTDLYFDSLTCTGDPLCNWYDSGGDCYDGDWNYINYFATYEDCIAGGGVFYMGSYYCYDLNDCSMQATQVDCESYYCIWYPNTCSGTLTCAAQLPYEEAGCTDVTGCSYTKSLNNTFNGTIDEFRISDETFSPMQVNSTIKKYFTSGDFTSFVYYNQSTVIFNMTATIINSTGEPPTTTLYSICQADNTCISYWDLGYENNNLYLSNDEKNVTFGGIPTNVNNATGINGGAARFNGVSSYLDTNSTVFDFKGTTVFTIAAWVNPSVVSGTQMVFSHDAGSPQQYSVELSDNKMRSEVNGGANYMASKLSLNANQWYFLVWSFESNNIKYYINGVLDNSYGSRPSIPDGPDATAKIGKRDYPGYPGYFNGAIDELLVYTRTLSADEIYNLYKVSLKHNANTNITYQRRTASNYNTSNNSLTGFWSFNAGNATDDSNNSYNGIVSSGIAINEQNGTIGKGAYFDGKNDWDGINISQDTIFNNPPFAISAWIKTGATGTKWVFSRDKSGARSYVFGMNNGYLACQINGVGGCNDDSNPNYMNDNNWHHVIYQGSSSIGWDFYLDGILVYEYGWSAPASTPATMTMIGQRGWNDGAWNGSIDDVRFYTKTLSQEEITNLYEMGSYHITDWSDWSDPLLITNNQSINYVIASSNFTQFKFNLYSNDSSLSPFLIDYSINAQNMPITVTDVIWKTTGGFTDDSLVYLQTMDYINATCTTESSELVYCNISIYDSEGITVIDNINMSNVSSSYTYPYDILLNKVGTWTVNITAVNDYGDKNTATETFTVNQVSQSLLDGIYGYSTLDIPSNATIENLANYNYNLIEFTFNSNNFSQNWSQIKTAIEKANDLTIKVGLRINITYNLTGPGANKTLFLQNISRTFSELQTAPYIDTVEYIKLDITNSSYTDKNITTDNLNVIGENISFETDNFFVIYSNYNSSTLDDTYLQFANRLHYATGNTGTELIDNLANLSRASTSKTRIYYNLTDTFKLNTMTYQDEVMIQITDTFNLSTTIQNRNVTELDNGELIVYNPLSVTQNYTINATNGTKIVGYDIWDYTKGLLLENNSNGTIRVLNIAANASVYLGTRELDYIKINDDKITSTAYETTSQGMTYSNHTDGVDEDNSAAHVGLYTEHWDGSYVKPKATLFYGDWSSHTGAEIPEAFADMNILILNDRDSDEDMHTIFNTSLGIGYVFDYMAVVDYYDSDGGGNATWVAQKKAEVDNITAINESMNVFIDGFDIGNVNDNGYFFSDVKQVVDYVKNIKGRELGVNIFTNFQEMAQFASPNGFAMYESCGGTWTICEYGVDTGCYGSYNRTHGYTFSNSAFLGTYGDYNKSLWYNSHNVPVVCVGFMGMNNTQYLPNPFLGTPHRNNFTLMEYLFLRNAVLGYENIVLTEPGFGLAHYLMYEDIGTKLQSEPTVQSDLYSMRYTKGIVYYNSTLDIAWFEDDKVFNNASVHMKLYDTATGIYDVCINDYCDYQYIAQGTWGKADVVFYLNETIWNESKGHYIINITSSPIWAGNVYVDTGNFPIYNQHSWYGGADGTPLRLSTGNYLVSMDFNVTRSNTIDTTDKIQQIESDTVLPTGRYKNITVNSQPYDFNSVIIGALTTITEGIYRKIQVWNETNWVTVTATDDATCITANPNFFINNILGIGNVGVCAYTGDGGVKIIFKWPHLSTIEARVDMDDLGPLWNETPSNKSLNYKVDSLYTRFNATDVGGTYYTINDTTRFNISQEGVLINVTWLSLANYEINVSVNDTYNVNSMLFMVNVSNAAPVISLVNLTTTNTTINDTFVNLTGYVTATDVSLDNISYAYNWYKNGRLNITTLITNGLIAYYPLNNDTLDYNGTNDGTCTNCPTMNTTSYKVDGSYTFDGSNDVISVPYTSTFDFSSMQFTFSFWVYINPSSTASMGFFDKYSSSTNRLGVWVEGTTNKVQAYMMDNSVLRCQYYTANNAVTRGTWNHIVFYANTAKCDMYINGVDKTPATYSFSNGDFSYNAPLRLGYYTVGYMKGELDEFAVFNRALSADEVNQLYLAGNMSGYKIDSSYTNTSDNWTLGVKAGDYLSWSAETNSSPVFLLSSFPAWNETPSDITLEYSVDELYTRVNASAINGISMYKVNYTTLINISQGEGIMQNTSLIPVGVYKVNISVNDTYNQVLSKLITLTVDDTIAPNLTFRINDTILESGVDFLTINGSVFDYSTISSTSLNITYPNGSIETEMIGITGNVYNSSLHQFTSPLGRWNVSWYSIDIHGNANVSTLGFDLIDTIVPKLTPPANITLQYKSQNLARTFTTVDYDTVLYYSVNDTTKFNITTSSTDGSLINNTFLDIGVYEVNVSVNDTSNNINYTIYKVTVADTLGPTVTLVSPTNQTLQTSLTSNFNYTSYDHSEVDNCTFFLDGKGVITNTTANLTLTNLTVGTHLWEVHCWDNYSNIGKSTNSTLTILALPVGGGSGDTSGAGGTSQASEGQKLAEATVYQNLFQRIFFGERDPTNSICDDGENLWIDKECKLSKEDITSLAILNTMWFIRLMLLLVVIMFARKSNLLPMVVILIIALLIMNGALGIQESTSSVTLPKINLSNLSPMMQAALLVGIVFILNIYTTRKLK